MALALECASIGSIQQDAPGITNGGIFPIAIPLSGASPS